MRPPIADISTPLVILCCQLGGLTFLRSLGPYGIDLYAVEEDETSLALRSKYLKQSFIKRLDPKDPEDYLALLKRIGDRIGRKAVLLPASDELSIFVATYRKQLREWFIFPENEASLIRNLADKREMFGVAQTHNVPTPKTLFPQNKQDVINALDDIEFPVMVKGIRGDRMQRRTGERMVVIERRDELVSAYERYEDPEIPNIMLQELIPGDDDQVFIFNGYFNTKSECLVGFTGHKLRQFPVHRGCASLGICRSNPTVHEQTVRLMQAVGYKGILDIGYRLDPRDGKYKVLDINPRVGQAMRIFVGRDGMDVVRAMYLDLTGQPVPPSTPIEERRWMIEDMDLVSCADYMKEGTLSVKDWLRSYAGVQETAYINWEDPVPSLLFSGRLAKKVGLWMYKSARQRVLS